MRTDTQLNIIRNHLLCGNPITPLEALSLCGCLRLSALIHTLRHKEEIPILMCQPEATNGRPYAKYWIDPAWLNAYNKDHRKENAV